MQQVKISLIQDKGTLEFSTPLRAKKNVETIAGTLSARIVALWLKSRKYKMNLGFSFARKFDVKLEINGQEVDGTNTILNGVMKFGLTLQSSEKTRDASMERFVAFITELVEEVINGTSQAEGSFDQLKKELNLEVA